MASRDDKGLSSILYPGKLNAVDRRVLRIRDYRSVAYGFVALKVADGRRDDSWSALATRPFRPLSLMVWPGPLKRSPTIDSIELSGEEQLTGSVPCYAFVPPISREEFVRQYLAADVLGSVPTLTSLELIATRLVEGVAAPTTWGVRDFPTVSHQAKISFRFTGLLLGFVLLGQELVE